MLIPSEGHAKVVINRACPLELEAIGGCQHVCNALWILGCYCKVINMNCYILIVVAIASHPNVGFSF
jgi:hypothetical protein